MVELDYPVTFTFLSNREERPVGRSFAPPKTIDCSQLRPISDAYKNAIEAGTLIVRIETPPQVTYTPKDEYGRPRKDKDGKEITASTKIKGTYGGVLALCKVSKNAIGPDSRRYWIRELDEHLANGKDGLVSFVGAELSYSNQFNPINELIETGLGVRHTYSSSSTFSWMLWLSDRTATFSDYEAEVARRKAAMPPPPPAPAQKQ